MTDILSAIAENRQGKRKKKVRKKKKKKKKKKPQLQNMMACPIWRP